MKQYNDNTLPVLKYLRWRRPLFWHPDFIKYLKNSKASILRHDKLTRYPFLQPEPINFISPSTKYQIMLYDAVSGLSRIWPEFADAAASKIEAISNTFQKAMESSYDAFLKPELFKELENTDLQGTIIFPDGRVICYDFIMFEPKEKNGKLTYLIQGNAIYLKEGRYLVCDNIEDTNRDGELLETMSWHDFSKMEYNAPEREVMGDVYRALDLKMEITDGVNDNILGMFDFVLVYHLFKKYAPIEEIISVRERKEHKDFPEIKTNQKIDYYDCNWYTTIVRNEGFNVRGHFRLQPYGVGRKEKKLIYIHEFQKHGYVRRARLLVNKEENGL